MVMLLVPPTNAMRESDPPLRLIVDGAPSAAGEVMTSVSATPGVGEGLTLIGPVKLLLPPSVHTPSNKLLGARVTPPPPEMFPVSEYWNGPPIVNPAPLLVTLLPKVGANGG